MKKREEKREPDNNPNLWIKCPATGELIYLSDLEAAQWVTPAGHHMRIGPEQRFRYLFDGAWSELKMPEVPLDPLKFKDDKRYTDRLKAARAKTGRSDCMAAAYGELDGAPVVILVQDFDFMGGSLGMAAGEGFITAAREAIQRRCPLICFSASGGARMQEGILSLMQMPRTTLAIEEVRAAGLPYLVVLTDPTSGGVTASYAMLGDIHLAEPGALIAFSGPRVIEQTIRQKLPEGFQRAEFLLDKGMVDAVVDRRQLKETLSALISVLAANRVETEEPELPLEDARRTAPPRLEPPRRPAARQRARAAE
ncbi:MAG: acetyl-CoA carboxylase, carboxyltransferase subunit beta [Hyphomonadaceae bacterium]